MKKILLSLILSLGIAFNAHASTQNQNEKSMTAATIKKMDKQMRKHKAKSRNFNTSKEFSRKQHKRMHNTHSKDIKYRNGYNYNNQRYRDNYRPTKQRGYRHSKRGWILAYQYDRASFYDNEGYFYGYFNRHGYYFEDVFYRYDRYYTYRDRIRGRGLFNRQYYMPVNARYYGFEISSISPYPQRDYDNRGHERGYDRY